MMGASEMKLTQYKVIKTVFELNESYTFTNKRIEIQPSFKRDIKKIDDHHYRIDLGILISPSIQKDSIPFICEIVIASVFELSHWENDAMKDLAINNSTAIMFPYLRTLVATVTMNGNVPPYVLPVMNINKLFQDNYLNEQKTS